MGSRFHPWVDATGCVGGPMDGTSALERALLELWGHAGATSLGIYSCRPPRSGGGWSIHAEGRALDLGRPASAVELGEQLLEALRERAWEAGLQRIIYRGHIYDLSTPEGRRWDDAGAHDLHLHIEQTRWAASTLRYEDLVALLGDGQTLDEGAAMDHLVRYGGLWIVAQDLSSKTPLASTADVEALLATGRMRMTRLTPAQMEKIPTVDTEDESTSK